MGKRRTPRARSAPVGLLSAPKQSKHQKKLQAMHDALYTLGNKIQPPMQSNDTGTKQLLPDNLTNEVPQDQIAQAKSHVDSLNEAFMNLKSGGSKNGRS